jgi:hypothetical protein
MMTDHYNLLCYILGIEAKPNNGSWNKVKDMTSDSGAKASQLITCGTSSAHSLLINVLTIFSIVILVILNFNQL